VIAVVTVVVLVEVEAVVVAAVVVLISRSSTARVRVRRSNSSSSYVSHRSGSGSIRNSINIGEVLIVTSEVAAIVILEVVMVVAGVLR